MQYQACFPTPFAVLGILCTPDGVTGIDFLPPDTLPDFSQDGMAGAVCRCLRQYLKDSSHPLDFPVLLQGTSFQQRVWSELRLIPPGQTVTYAELARRTGSGARAVANACGANPVPILIPCHRVVSANGLGGFMRGRQPSSLNIKRWLLDHERSASGAA